MPCAGVPLEAALWHNRQLSDGWSVHGLRLGGGDRMTIRRVREKGLVREWAPNGI